VTVRELLLADDLTTLYHDGADDPDFDRVLAFAPAATETDLADLIEADGRLRLRLQRPVTLERYLHAVPDLARQSDALDAAIDMALRALARTGRADEQAVRALVERFPELGPAIRDAAALNNALWSTQRVRRHVAETPVKALPCDFGPGLEGGGRRYELRELLGQGAFGQVYLAVDRQLSEEDHPAFVSIKVLASEDRPRWTRQQLIDEATKARRINHPNVARVLDRGVSGRDEDFLVYEYVEGGDLARWARRRSGRVPIREAAALVSGVARGVHAAHMAGLVHCDLKPNNIVITAEGEPKVADFGVAIRSDRQRPSDRIEAAPIGNLAFMSPEQYRMEEGALTIPTDVYALGGILYWLLTGVLPNGATPDEIHRAHDPHESRGGPPPVRSLRPDVDRDLAAVCRRALAAQSGERFASAAELADSLDAWLRREPIAWTKPSPLHRTKLWVRRRPTLAIASGLVAITLLAGGAALWHFAAVARQKRFDAAVAEARLVDEADARVSFKGTMRRRFHRAVAEGLAHEVLPQIWLTEWLLGPTVLGTGDDRFDLWELRIDCVRDLLMNAQAAGDENSFQAMQWESALGFWLAHDWYSTEAELVLADNYARWAAVLDPQDPWLIYLKALYACALVGKYSGCDYDSPAPPVTSEHLWEVATALEYAEDSLNADHRGTPLHHVVLVNLELIYGPDLLDRPARRAQVARKLDIISE
jgi:predicted Ser/Thr protein kinase